MEVWADPEIKEDDPNNANFPRSNLTLESAPIFPGDSFKWNFIKQFDGSYKITSALNFKYRLNVYGSDTNNAEVEVLKNGTQTWDICSAGSGLYYLKPSISGERVMETFFGTSTIDPYVTKQSVRINPHSNNDDMQWELVNVATMHNDIYNDVSESGYLLEGMKMRKGANSPVISTIRLLLAELEYCTWQSITAAAAAGVQNIFDDDVLDLINDFKADEQISNSGDDAGVIDLQVWTCLWLAVIQKPMSAGFNQLFTDAGEEGMYANGKVPICRSLKSFFRFYGELGGDTIKMSMPTDNKLLFKYYPKIYVEGLDSIQSSHRPAYETAIKDRIEAGVKRWDSFLYIYGVNCEIEVEVLNSQIVADKSQANIILTPVVTLSDIQQQLNSAIPLFVQINTAHNISIISLIYEHFEGSLHNMVPESIIWSYNNKNTILFREFDINTTMSYNPSTNTATITGINHVLDVDLIMHEFGHVLGIFDAYAYEYGSSIFCPGVSDNELIGWDSTKTDVMRSSSDVTNLHAKMLLFA